MIEEVVDFNSNAALTPLQTRGRPFQLAKMEKKIRDFNVDFWKILWGYSPQNHIMGRGYSAPPQTPPPRGHLDCQVLRAPQYLNPAC